MANILVAIELRGGAPLGACLEALGQARRIGTELGATVYALLPLARPPTYAEGDLLALLSTRGADKVVLITDESIGSATTLRWNSHGPALAAACEQMPPTLLVFASTFGAREIAPRLAARLGAAFIADGWMHAAEGLLAIGHGTQKSAALLDAHGALPAVVTIAPGLYREADCDEEAEVEILTVTAPSDQFEPLSPAEAPTAPAPPETRAQVVTAHRADPGLDASAEQLAASLGGKVVDRPRGRTNLVVWLARGEPSSSDPLLAEVQVSLGDDRSPTAHYHVPGGAAELAVGLAAELAATGAARGPG